MTANTLAAYAGRNQIEANYIPVDTTQITSAANYSAPQPGDPCHPLASGAHPPAIAHALKAKGNLDHREDSDTLLIVHTLKAEGHDASEDGTGRGVPLIAFDPTTSLDQAPNAETAPPLKVGTGSLAHLGWSPAIQSAAMVRRLTATECELLQGFPPGWTCTCGAEPYTTATCRCPDSPRYRALGNAVTVNVAFWIGQRLRAWG